MEDVDVSDIKNFDQLSKQTQKEILFGRRALARKNGSPERKLPPEPDLPLDEGEVTSTGKPEREGIAIQEPSMAPPSRPQDLDAALHQAFPGGAVVAPAVAPQEHTKTDQVKVNEGPVAQPNPEANTAGKAAKPSPFATKAK